MGVTLINGNWVQAFNGLRFFIRKAAAREIPDFVPDCTQLSFFLSYRHRLPYNYIYSIYISYIALIYIMLNVRNNYAII